MANEDPINGVVISFKDIYDQLILTKDAVRDLKISVDNNKERDEEEKKAAAARTSDIENRMRNMEKWRYSIPPTIIVAIISLIATGFKYIGGN